MSVDTLMSAAGLTGGAFYVHFGSKEELFVEIIGSALDRSAQMLGPQEGETPLEWVAKAFDNYLTVGHVRHPESGCVLPALGAEIARAEPGVRKLYENAMMAVKDRWAEGIGDPDVTWATSNKRRGCRMLRGRLEVSSVLRCESIDSSRPDNLSFI
jgi:TetR/AcrR family transcriptional repressor of nem operon